MAHKGTESNQNKKGTGTSTDKVAISNNHTRHFLIPPYLKKPPSIDKDILLQFFSKNICENERYFDNDEFWRLQTNCYFENEQGQLEIKCEKCFNKNQTKNYLKIKNIADYKEIIHKLNKKVERNRSKVKRKLKQFLSIQDIRNREFILTNFEKGIDFVFKDLNCSKIGNNPKLRVEKHVKILEHNKFRFMKFARAIQDLFSFKKIVYLKAKYEKKALKYFKRGFQPFDNVGNLKSQILQSFHFSRRELTQKAIDPEKTYIEVNNSKSCLNQHESFDKWKSFLTNSRTIIGENGDQMSVSAFKIMPAKSNNKNKIFHEDNNLQEMLNLQNNRNKKEKEKNRFRKLESENINDTLAAQADSSVQNKSLEKKNIQFESQEKSESSEEKILAEMNLQDSKSKGNRNNKTMNSESEEKRIKTLDKYLQILNNEMLLFAESIAEEKEVDEVKMIEEKYWHSANTIAEESDSQENQFQSKPSGSEKAKHAKTSNTKQKIKKSKIQKPPKNGCESSILTHSDSNESSKLFESQDWNNNTNNNSQFLDFSRFRELVWNMKFDEAMYREFTNSGFKSISKQSIQNLCKLGFKDTDFTMSLGFQRDQLGGDNFLEEFYLYCRFDTSIFVMIETEIEGQRGQVFGVYYRIPWEGLHQDNFLYSFEHDSYHPLKLSQQKNDLENSQILMALNNFSPMNMDESEETAAENKTQENNLEEIGSPKTTKQV